MPPPSLDEIRLLANVNARAARLFEDGYRAGWLDDHLLEVLTPSGETYEIDVISGNCSCPFYAKHGGRHGCKHLLGYRKLLTDQEAMPDYHGHPCQRLQEEREGMVAA